MLAKTEAWGRYIMGEQVILTKDGLLEIQQKLDYLKTVRRAEISEQIKEARSFGDLSENAEYDEAKNEQARVETEIAQLEKLLRNAVVVEDAEIDHSVVSIGTTVRILDLEYGEEEEYHIVGSVEHRQERGRHRGGAHALRRNTEVQDYRYS